jgi:hypothetical protein
VQRLGEEEEKSLNVSEYVSFFRESEFIWERENKLDPWEKLESTCTDWCLVKCWSKVNKKSGERHAS